MNDPTAREVTYYFTPDFFEMKYIGTTIVFGNRDLPIKNLLMIDRHYLNGQLINSYEF